ncbi:hypothetical protein E8E12_001706 [Didymella heteroderae]|uniref:Uncharacterized protein n=1 Tax=Didymella heteroderae TaxID=1769908 RepID=A0A9P4WGC9_9PLEO|nr:hypothetical protein E8E12_001706 [Didymella heteroderae]
MPFVITDSHAKQPKTAPSTRTKTLATDRRIPKPKKGGGPLESKSSKPTAIGSTHKIPLERPDNAFDLLGRDFRWPISVFAVIAAWDMAWSGSRALDLWSDGHGSSKDSDLDFYTPSTAGALVDLCFVFNFAEIRWHNYVVQKLELLKTERTIIIPSAMILSLARFLGAASNKAEDAVDKKLREYLQRRAQRSGFSSKMARLFIFRFCEKVNEYRQLLNIWGEDARSTEQSEDHVESRVWIFHTGDGGPSQEESHFDGISNILNTLSWVCNDITEEEFRWSEVKAALHDVLDDSPLRVATIGQVLTFEDGLSYDMLREFLTFMLITGSPYQNRPKIYMIVREALRLGGNSLEQEYGDDFRIMSGVMPNGKKVQIVFDKTNQTHPFYTILQFYATHVMQGIVGTGGAHLYHSTARNLQSQTLDFSKDKRSPSAKDAINKKYKPRDWTFQDMDRKAIRTRDMSDSDTQVIDFEQLYAAALSEVRDEHDLPNDIKSFFAEKRDQLTSLTWNERCGRIPKVEIHSNYTKGVNTGMNSRIKTAGANKGASFVKWVHETLDGHRWVVPKDKWETQNILDAKLNVFFRGFHSI